MRDLPGSRPIRPPERISPSQASTSSRCGLRFVLDKSTPEAEQDLPSPSPFRYLGSVFHALVEAARRGEAGDPPTEVALREKWRDLVTRQEAQAARNGDGDWLPLASIRGIERTRLSAIRLAVRQPVRSGAGTGKGTSEVLLESPDGTVVGKVDAIDRSCGTVRLTDFKSGAAVDSGGAVSEEYRLQLRLYAALYYEVEGMWPDELCVVDRRSGSHEVHLDREQALQDLRSLRDRLRMLRDTVRDGSRSGDPHVIALAEPNPKACASCRHRPSCRPYLTQLEERGLARLGEEDFDSVDLHGTLIGATPIDGDRLRIQLRAQSGSFVVRGLTHEGQVRLGELQTVPPSNGDVVVVFGARPSRSSQQTSSPLLFDKGPATRAFVVRRGGTC